MMFPKSRPWRSEKHRRNVAALPCACCGRWGLSQCAHVNFGKMLGRKASDSLTFPLCADEPGRIGCHRLHDSGGMPKKRRWLMEWNYVDATRAELIQRGQWGPEVEAAYREAIGPLANAVHGEVA